MNDARESQPSESWWRRLWRRPSSRWAFGIPLGGLLAVVVGVAGTAGFNATLHWSNTLDFCAHSCHEMSDNMLPEYIKSPHYKNEVGVRAICSDCHVPKDFVHKMRAKMGATVNELPKWLFGTLRDPAKFQAARLDMAKDVWAKMKASDSRECRNCHSIESMDLELQDSRAAKKHDAARMKERDETCIDCHKGIGHGLPPGYDG